MLRINLQVKKEEILKGRKSIRVGTFYIIDVGLIKVKTEEDKDESKDTEVQTDEEKFELKDIEVQRNEEKVESKNIEVQTDT